MEIKPTGPDGLVSTNCTVQYKHTTYRGNVRTQVIDETKSGKSKLYVRPIKTKILLIYPDEKHGGKLGLEE